MSDTNVAVRYAQALFEVTREDKIEQVNDLLTYLSNSLSQPEIRKFLLHPQTTLAMKFKLIRSLNLEQPLEPFLLLVFEKKRDNLLKLISKEFTRLINKKHNITTAQVQAAIQLNPETITRIKDRLETLTGKNVKIEFMIDPSIWGGLKIGIDGKVIDLSLLSSFKQMQQNLLTH